MRPLITVWPYTLVFWLVFIWAYATESVLTVRTGSVAGKQDAGSLRLILSTQFVAIAAAFIIASNVRAGSLPHLRVWFWTGLGAMVAGSLLRRHCFRMLGSSFTTAVVVMPQQNIVERGAYRWVRHPSYTGGLLMQTGIGLALGNWISAAMLLAIVSGSYMYRVRVEERALLETLGQPYRQYMQRTKRFIPLIF
jgi:protein-S-isoprenylcysteine O-methyltransferase Ste14